MPGEIDFDDVVDVANEPPIIQQAPEPPAAAPEPVIEPAPSPAPKDEPKPAPVVEVPKPEPVAAPKEVPAPVVEAAPALTGEAKKIYDLLAAGKLDDVTNTLSERRMLAGVKDMAPEDAVRLAIKYENPDADKAELDAIFQEKYYVPDKPVKGEWDTDEDFARDMKRYNTEVAGVNRAIAKDARDARKELTARIADIQFPDNSPAQQQAAQPTPEQQADYQRRFKNAMEDADRNFTGFKVSYKDGEVEYGTEYTVTPEEKALLSSRMPELNLEEYFGNRYKGLNIAQLQKDIYTLENLDKILAANAKDAATQRLAQHIKQQKNIGPDNDKGSSNPLSERQSFVRQALTQLGHFDD